MPVTKPDVMKPAIPTRSNEEWILYILEQHKERPMKSMEIKAELVANGVTMNPNTFDALMSKLKFDKKILKPDYAMYQHNPDYKPKDKE